MGAPRKNLKEGDVLGVCTFLEYRGKNKKRAFIGKFRCKCGNIFESPLWWVDIHFGTCGCAKGRKGEKNGRYTHGVLVGGGITPEYISYRGMKDRCYNPENKAYHNYGQRGVIVCGRWLGKDGFTNFLSDMGKKPSPLHSLDRYPNNETGIYEPTNCRWGTDEQQARNKRNNIWLTVNGKTMIVEDWGKEMGVNPQLISGRIKKGWSPEMCITQPNPNRSKNKNCLYLGTLSTFLWANKIAA